VNSSRNKRSAARLGIVALAVMVAGLALPACDRAATPSAQAATPADDKACSEFASKVCEKAGKGSGTCSSVEATTKLLSNAACAAANKDIEQPDAKLADARKACDSLTEKLCGDLGKETETCKMVQAQTKQFPPERCTAMLEHYPEVLAQLQQMENRNKPLSREQQAAIAKADAPTFGPADAKVTIVEFSDFECPYCSRAATATQEIKKKYGDKVRIVFRQFPLSFHQNAELAAQASLAANAQGKFWQFHDKLFENQKALTRKDLEGYAKAVGLDLAKFNKALDSKEFADEVQRDLKLGGEVNVDGTPTMFINGQRVSNPGDVATVSKTIDSAIGG